MSWESNPLFWFLVAGLACWRISALFVWDSIFGFLRKWVGIDPSDDSYPDKFLARLFSCLRCFSVWSGIFCTLIVLFFYPVVLLPFALSGAAIILEENLL